MSIRWIKDGEPHSAEVYNRPLRDYIQEAETTFAKQSLNIEVSNGLSGGGKLVGDVVNISANDATTQQKGVVRFATLEEANEGTPGVVVSPDVVKNMTTPGLGVGQKWRSVLGSRGWGGSYINDTGKPIQVAIGWRDRGGRRTVTFYIDGVSFPYGDSYKESNYHYVSYIVPAGSTYRIVGSDNLLCWNELR